MSNKLQAAGIILSKSDGIDFFMDGVFFNFKKIIHHDIAHHSKRKNQAQ